ncbi:MAG: S41 family peptidase [Candidatus Yanofskybacteria bacterium]|nr:S41 family peptidase [Candidatus Yanofskybacteria bacterium]
MTKKLNNKIIFIVLVVALLGGGFYAGTKFEKSRSNSEIDEIVTEISNKGTGQPASIDFGLFWTALSKLEEKFVDQEKLQDKRNLVYGAIEGMVNSLGDPYTAFLKPEESKKFEEQINGSFGGVGIEIGMRKNLLTVIAPIKDTPAYKAGILAGDIITKINDKDAGNLTIDEAVTQIRGKRGTSVKLTIQRNGDKDPKEFNLTREEIKIPTIDWKLLDGNVAHIQLFTFNRNIDADFNKTAREILASQAEKIILDLRNNPGGILDSAVNIASWFLGPNETVVSERFADRTETVLKTNNNGQLKKYPLIIIINKGSASASEILAGALRDNRGVKIVGETSFGKGSVQELVEFLSGNKKSTLKITIAKWFTPGGISISDNGIKPDFEVKKDEEETEKDPLKDPQLEKALEVLK